MIRIFTDTSANLSDGFISQYNINVLPFTFTVNGAESDPTDTRLRGSAFYNLLRDGVNVKTSSINVGSFIEHFEPVLAAGNDILYIGMSGGISGTASTAVVAARELREEYPQRKITVIDSLSASLGEGIIVLKAAQLINGGADLDTAALEVLNLRDKMCQCFTVDSIEYLRRGGRVSGAAAFIGGVLGIKPLLKGDREGKIVSHGKARGIKRALDMLAEDYNRLVTDRNETVGIAHADNPDAAKYLAVKLKEKGFKGELITACYEPVTGSHVGPGTVALFFFGENRNLI